MLTKLVTRRLIIGASLWLLVVFTLFVFGDASRPPLPLAQTAARGTVPRFPNNHSDTTRWIASDLTHLSMTVVDAVVMDGWPNTPNADGSTTRSVIDRTDAARKYLTVGWSGTNTSPDAFRPPMHRYDELHEIAVGWPCRMFITRSLMRHSPPWPRFGTLDLRPTKKVFTSEQTIWFPGVLINTLLALPASIAYATVCWLTPRRHSRPRHHDPLVQ